MHSILLGSLVVFYTNLTRSRNLHSLFHFLPLDGVIYLAEKITYSACGLCGPFELNLLRSLPLFSSPHLSLFYSLSVLAFCFDASRLRQSLPVPLIHTLAPLRPALFCLIAAD